MRRATARAVSCCCASVVWAAAPSATWGTGPRWKCPSVSVTWAGDEEQAVDPAGRKVCRGEGEVDRAGGERQQRERRDEVGVDRRDRSGGGVRRGERVEPLLLGDDGHAFPPC